MAKLSDWQSGDTKPTLVGVYETTNDNGQAYYQYWSGCYWCYTAWTVADATKAKGKKSKHQQGLWRGVIDD